MPQVNIPISMKKLAAGAGILAAAAFCANLVLSPSALAQLDAQAMRSIKNEGTFKSVQGDGSRTIHVFISTECSFCHKIEPELDQLENVTVYRHLLPGHTDSGRQSAIDVWCSENRIQAWKAVSAGGGQAGSAQCDSSAVEKNLELAKNLGLTMTPSIVYQDGQVSAGLLSSEEIAKRITKATAG